MQGDWNAKVGKDACGNRRGICGPFCNDDTNDRGLRLLEFATFNDLVLAKAKHPEDGSGITQMDNTTTRLITFYEEALPIKSEHCQNTKFAWSRH